MRHCASPSPTFGSRSQQSACCVVAPLVLMRNVKIAIRGTHEPHGSRETQTCDGAKCVPGLTVACPCPTGQNGSQTCTSAGTFAACVCATPMLDAGGLGGVVGTASSSVSSSTGGQGAQLLDAGMGGTGGVMGLSTSAADANPSMADLDAQIVTADSGWIADIGAEAGSMDVPYASTRVATA